MNSKQQKSAITKESHHSSKNDHLGLIRSQAATLSLARSGNQDYVESAAITSTTAIISLILSAFTLFALYTGL